MANKKYLVRGRDSGVFFGEIKERNGQEVTMTNARRIWYWEGAASLSQLAKEGTKQPSKCKFTVPVDEMIVLDAIEIDACTEEAVNSIEAVQPWRV